MSRVPIVDADTMERVPLRLGFVAERQRGSHVFYHTRMGERRPSLIMRGAILRDP